MAQGRIPTNMRFGMLLCEALGLDPNTVSRIQIDIEPGKFAGAAEVVVTHMLRGDQAEVIAGHVRTFAVVVKDDAP